jgi:hypothetical protein
MEWFRDRWLLFWEAYSRHTWAFTAVLLLCTAFATSDYLKEIISRWIDLPQAGTVVLGIPVPLLGILLFVLVLFLVMLEYSFEQKKAVTPTIEVSFNPKGEGIILTPVQFQLTDQKGNVAVGEDEAVYVSITANVISKKTVKNIVGFITKIEKRKTLNQFIEIPVYGYISLGAPGDAYPRVPTVMNVVRSSRTTGKLDFVQPAPLRLRDVFKDHATYRFTIEVSGDGVTETIRVDVDWTGKWDEIKARQVQSK